MSLATSRLLTPDGAEIEFRRRPGRDPIVLLHGLGCDPSMWDGVVAALAADVGLVIPALRGHGGSTLGWRAPSVDLWADDVSRILSQERIQKPAIAGLSMGGYVAFALAAAHPDLARSYAFISTSAAPDDDAGRLRRAAGIATIRREGWRAYLEQQLPGFLNVAHPEFERRKEHLTAMFAAAGDSGLSAALMALAARPDRRPMLATIHRASIVVAGSIDTLIPPDRAQAIAAGIPGGRIQILDGVAHLSAMEAPGPIAGILAGL